ncbi:MAG: sulfatase-like hydrolase/transferase [Acidobacteria bacterium]|nr:sulfatase-like hydrolase/transferase [Acidobacteriota bacterium]
MTLTRRQILLSSLAVAAGPVAAQQRRPNILFCIADDWGWPHAGAYGAGDWVKTPAFDRLAREGVLFTNAFTSNPKCSPCRATILTGRNTWQLEEAINHFGVFPHKWKVFPEVLEDAGYHVGFTGKGWGPGDYEAGGFDRNPAGPEFSKIKLDPPYRFISPTDYAANFADFLSKRPSGAPFSFWLGGHEPHRAYEDGAGEKAGKDWRKVEVPKFYAQNDETIKRDMTDYAVEAEHFDSHVGKALKKLEEIGELDNTLVVMTSDHGMPFPRVKGQIYEMGFHLPMAVRWGGMQGGRKIDDFINVRDLMPTFLELAGVPIPNTVTGKSFLGVLKSNKSGTVDSTRNRMIVGKERHDLGRPDDAGYPVRAIRTPDFLYVRNYEPDAWPAGNPETGYRNVDDSPTKGKILGSFNEWYRLSFGKRPAEELYNVSEDPACVNNLADKPEFFQMKTQLRDEMQKTLEAEGDPRALGHEEVFETYRYTGRRTHSYESWLENQKQ